MDLHILIVIACVFLASLGSLLFINKFLRRKTFEEIIAEKKALTEKIYGKEKATLKKPKKQSLKKELKREKKQRLREQVTTTEQEDSDAHSEQGSVDDEPQGLSKTHVEFVPDPEIVTYNNQTTSRRSSTAEKENSNKQSKGKKDKKCSGKPGILINTNEQNIVKENLTAEVPSNHFDIKTPKDAVELKKLEKKEEKSQINKKEKNAKKFDNRQVENVQSLTEVAAPVVIKEMKQLDEKVRQSSPKTTQQKNKQQKKQKDLKDAVVGLEKLSESDTVGVSLLMNLFRRAELNRSEIQILIDYLLNRQQDVPSSHSEWSDDICQKLKRQLEEKEKALTEEQEASIGIQAKLRELRTEINTERASMSSTIKSYVEKIQAKDQDIALLEQKIKTLNDNFSLERQQIQAKLIHEKQSGSQDLLAQLQMMRNELAHKDKFIAELNCIVNASRQAVEESQQKNEIIQNQVQQLRTLEQQRDELEQVSNNRIFELEQAKQLENELNDAKVELRNLQNALESARSDAGQSSMEIESLKNELSLVRNKGIVEKQQEVDALQAKNSELTQQIMNIANKTQEQSKEQTGLQANLDTLKKQLAEKEQQLAETETAKSEMQQQSKQQSAEQTELQNLVESLKKDVSSKNQQLQNSEQQAQNQQELQKLVEFLKSELKAKEKQLQDTRNQTQQQNDLQKIVDALKADVSEKNQQLKEVEQQTEKLNSKEKELLQQLQEQKEKNNQQEKLLAVTSKPGASGGSTDTGKDQKLMRDLLQRLCPDAVKACAGTALSVSLNQWVEQVLTTHIKQQQVNSTHKSTQSPSLQSPQNSHHNLNNANGSRSSSSSSANSPGGESSAGGNGDQTELIKENSILRVRNDELTKLARKTENTLSDLMKQAEDQDEHWRNIMRSKDEQISALQHSNGQEDI